MIAELSTFILLFINISMSILGSINHDLRLKNLSAKSTTRLRRTASLRRWPLALITENLNSASSLPNHLLIAKFV